MPSNGALPADSRRRKSCFLPNSLGQTPGVIHEVFSKLGIIETLKRFYRMWFNMDWLIDFVWFLCTFRSRMLGEGLWKARRRVVQKRGKQDNGWGDFFPSHPGIVQTMKKLANILGRFQGKMKWFRITILKQQGKNLAFRVNFGLNSVKVRVSS